MQYQIRPPIPIPIRHAPAPPKESLRHPLPAYENPIAPARDLPASRKYRRSRRAPSPTTSRHNPCLARRASRAPSPTTSRHNPCLARRRPPPLRPNLAPHQQHNQGD